MKRHRNSLLRVYTTGDGLGVSGGMILLKPDPAAAQDNAVKSLCRAAIATGLSAIDRGVRHGCG